MSDNVNHPSHYEKNCSIECIDSMLIAFGEEAVVHFCICNAYKYLWRHTNKNGMEDLDKARWYLRKASDIIDNARDTWHYGVIDEKLKILEEEVCRYIVIAKKEA